MLPSPSSAVPVLPATFRPAGNPTLAAVPPWTTSCIIWFSSAAVCGLTAWPRVCGVVFVTVDPSAATTFCTRYGFGRTPLLAIVAPTSAIWSGVASMLYCPNASRPESIWELLVGVQSLLFLYRPDALIVSGGVSSGGGE